jgi:hypothetical protein
MNSKNQFWSRGIGNDADLLGHFIISHSMLKVRGSTPRTRSAGFRSMISPL